MIRACSGGGSTARGILLSHTHGYKNLSRTAATSSSTLWNVNAQTTNNDLIVIPHTYSNPHSMGVRHVSYSLFNSSTIKHSRRCFSSNTTQTASSSSNDHDTFYTKSSDASAVITEEGSSFSTSNLLENASATSSDLVFSPTWYNPVDNVVTLLNHIDSLHSYPFAITIIGSTLAIRAGLLPLFINAQKNSSRMAHMQPEMQVLKEKLDRMGKNTDAATQQRFQEQMQALFKRYDCNPLKSLIAPLVQMPIFMSMFFALRKMPTYFESELEQGGLLWFYDLTQYDPYYILPVASSLTFLATIELSKANMSATSTPAQSQLMTNVFRGMAVIMVPATMYFPTAVLCYWVTNNTFTLFQSMTLQQKSVRKMLGIWDPPKPVPGAPQVKGIMEMWQEFKDKQSGATTAATATSAEDKAEAIKLHNEELDNRKLEMQSKKKKKRVKKKRSRSF